MTRLALRVERRRFISAIIALTFCLSAMLGLLVTSSSDMIDTGSREGLTGASRIPVRALALTSHDPILIDGNAGFTNASGVAWGSGTEADPFIIEGWDISGPRGVTRISILNADAYFIIRGCSLHDSEASSGGSGVGLTACRNGTIEACTSFNHDEGIIVRQSTGIVVRDCYCFNNSRGISVSGSEMCLVTNNTCADGNQYGIYLEDGSGNNTAIGNNCSYNDETGISLSSTWNNTVSYNTCEHGSRGFEVSGARSNTITNNLCRFNDEQGIYLYGTDNSVFDNDCSNNIGDGIYLVLSSNNTLINNTCSSGGGGIEIYSSNANIVSNNICSDNFYGIALFSSNNNTISSNNCSDNSNGMLIDGSSNNTVFGNHVCNDTGYGVFIRSGSCGNRVWNNTFIDNNGASDTYDASHVQAGNDGTTNWWNSTDGHGNYWSDWTTPDLDFDGIVDNPYSLDGSAGAEDHYPLTTAPPEPIPEFGLMPFVVICFMAVIVLAEETRRKRKS